MTTARILILLLLCCLFCHIASSEMIYTRDNRVYQGEIVEKNEKEVVVNLGYGKVVIPRSAIERIEEDPADSPTPTSSPTPRPTNTRFPTSTVTPTSTATAAPIEELEEVAQVEEEPDDFPFASSSTKIYSLEEADRLISKYKKARTPKAKYALAYYSKGIHAMQDDRLAEAIKMWTEALDVNTQVFLGAELPDHEDPVLEVRFEKALETLSTESVRDPNAAISMNRKCQQAIQDIKQLSAWADRQCDILIGLGKAYLLSDQENLAIQNLLRAYRLLRWQRDSYRDRVLELTTAADPFSLRGIFAVPRIEVDGMLLDSRIVEIETILDQQFDLQPDDYQYDYE